MSKDHNSLIVGKVLLEFEKLDSTNEYALQLLGNNDVVEGTVIYTHHQQKGRGQMGTTWLSDAHANLTFSVILYPTFLSSNQQFYLNKAVTLACIQSLTGYFGEDVKIKWPNDIFVNARKIAGILIQNIIQGDHIKASIIGIGLNVNQTSWPEDIQATSIQKQTNEEHAINEIGD